MKDNVWAAQFRDSFNPQRYVYHYTSFETALKILYGDTFLFSPFSKTNDTAEQKSRVVYAFDVSGDMRNDISKFEEYWLRWIWNSQMLCFSRDRMDDNTPDSERPNRFEMSGRGFALPRMWAQYGETNSGVCLIIKKDELVKQVRDNYPSAITKNVNYLEWHERYPVTRELFDKIIKVVRNDYNTQFAPELLQQNPSFADHLFFAKNKDWSGENEFRIVIPYMYDTRLKIEGVKSMLAGIVVGENIPDAYVYALNAVTQDACKFRKIFFELTQCRIRGIQDVQ